ncbi:MAG TPA: twin-arginine translocase subunit TatA [Porticoccaceae bacterium]|nr:twin-arginine translocase subunit TatA [Porticoccaceae bacterium]
MGLGGISIWQLVIILVIVVLIFGTRRLKGMGSDLGGAIKGFKEAVSNDDDDDKSKSSEDAASVESDHAAAKQSTEEKKPNHTS